MGLMDSMAKGLMNGAESFAKSVERKAERIEHYKSIYECKSDEQLKKLLKSTADLDRKSAIIMLLQERGY